jgi:hypothetical protein
MTPAQEASHVRLMDLVPDLLKRMAESPQYGPEALKSVWIIVPNRAQLVQFRFSVQYMTREFWRQTHKPYGPAAVIAEEGTIHISDLNYQAGRGFFVRELYLPDHESLTESQKRMSMFMEKEFWKDTTVMYY